MYHVWVMQGNLPDLKFTYIWPRTGHFSLKLPNVAPQPKSTFGEL